ncbi:MAG: hypothetical protein FJ025_03005, partial [Chloroflexi bacterium]|nr:hypothetical protein [Chloroflexota bacterium]
MNIWWLIIGIIYIALAIPYFHLARKARQKIDIKNFQINKMSGERFMPTGNAALEVNMTLDQHGISSEIRSASLKIIVDYANQLIDNVQHHLNHVILP